MSRYADIFEEQLSTGIGDFTAHIDVTDGVKSVFRKARPVPYVLKGNEEDELHRLDSICIIKKVEQSGNLLFW